MKRKHAELIHAWADGAEIGYQQSHSKTWVSIRDPVWDEDTMYRIKPADKVVRWLWVDPNERKLLMYYATEFEASHTKGLIKAEWSRMEFDK